MTKVPDISEPISYGMIGDPLSTKGPIQTR